ncbi:CBS domain-containing protein [Streptomyces meridianus]|uniref:CBS domain-containing protein n=1 Tax=Streptomyces meridianus TaxID=2938945 RepID=A0ABT0X660_9ACTN|nr:CBS domain-containing protein [Streptomyces meridianus]MCM2577413.1 CBS domain-containing protein [Streptomyces meridianus]
MRHRAVGSLMAGDVVTVTAPTPSSASADLMEEHRINGLPVVDADDRVVGMLSASDLRRLRTSEEDVRRGDGRRGRLPRAVRRPGKPAARTARGRRTTGDVMTVPAIVVHAEESIAEVARTMAGRGVERLPVVDEEDRLVGIVTRRDLMEVFLRPDGEIRGEVTETVLGQTLGLPSDAVDVRVADGVVTLKGRLGRAGELPVLLRLVQQVDGVVSVVDELTASG